MITTRDKNEILDDTVSAMLICSGKACHNDLEDGDIDDLGVDFEGDCGLVACLWSCRTCRGGLPDLRSPPTALRTLRTFSFGEQALRPRLVSLRKTWGGGGGGGGDQSDIVLKVSR